MKPETLSFAPTIAPEIPAVPVDLDRLVASRMLLQANSGGGKSRALRSLLEGTHGRVQHLVLDPEGEFATLRQAFPYVLAGKEGDVPATPKTAAVLCRRLMELGASAIIDLYDLSAGDRREFVHRFLTELMHLPRALWHPTLVIIDEAHQFAPERGSGEAVSTDAVITLCSQGRKRGYAAVLATQRISKLHKDAAAELLNKLVGRTGLDVDLRRAGDELGMDKESRMQLRTLEPGEFFAYGPAIGAAVQKVRTAAVQTAHPGGGNVADAIAPPPASLQAVLAQLGDLPRAAEEEATTIAQLKEENARLVRELRAKTAPVSADVITRDEHLREIGLVNQRLRDLNAGLRVKGEALHQAARTAVEAAGVVQDHASMLAALYAPPETKAGGASPHVPDMRLVQSVSTVAPPPRERPQVPVRRAGDPSGPQLNMLSVLATLEGVGIDPVPRPIVAVMSGQSPRSSGFDKNCSTLRSGGYIEYFREGLALTVLGRETAYRATTVATITTLEQIQEAWKMRVSGPQAAMLDRLIVEWPQPLNRDFLAGATKQSHTSSGFDKNCSTLRSLGLIEYLPGKRVQATALLFPPALRDRAPRGGR